MKAEIVIKRNKWPTPDDVFQVWLIVGVQQFTVGTPHADAVEAKWYAEQLQTALRKSGIEAEITES
jgi:predicted aconitase